MKKFCTKCGKPFEAVGREVICPACKQAAAEESKKAAVLKAKKASWNGESVPVRISGRASTLIREYGAEKSLPFAAALDALLKETDCFKSLGMAWEDITPYKSRRRDKATSTTENKQDAPQDAQEVTKVVQAAGKPQDAQDTPQEVKQAAKVANKTSKSKATSKAAAGKKA